MIRFDDAFSHIKWRQLAVTSLLCYNFITSILADRLPNQFAIKMTTAYVKTGCEHAQSSD